MPKINWADAQAAWEGGASKNMVAKTFGVSVTAISAHQNKEGWKRIDAESVGTPATVDLSDHPQVMVHDLAAELDAAQAEIAKLRTQVQATVKEAYVPIMDTAADVVDFYGAERLEKMAARVINRERKTDGFPPHDFSEEVSPKVRRQLESRRDEIVQLVLDRKTMWAGTNNLRTVKMAYPDKTQPGGFRLVAIPVEQNFNNEKANPGANLRHYQRKGFLLAVPTRCMRAQCWAKAAADGGGRLLFGGYCSVEHQADDPLTNARRVGGVTSTETVRMIPS